MTLLRLRPHGLQPRPRRQLPDLRGHGRPAPHPAAPRVPGPRGHEHHRRGRPDHPEGPGSGHGPRAPSPPSTSGPSRRTWRRCASSGPSTCPARPTHIPEMIDLIERLAGAGPHLHRRRQRLLPHRLVPRVRPARRGSTWPGSRPGRGSTPTSTRRRTRGTSCSGRSKSDEPEWAQWDAPFGRGRPGLAHRVLGHEHEVPGRDLRPPLRAGRTSIFPHHENEIAQSDVRHRQALRAALDARQAPADRQRDDVEEQGELLHDPRPRSRRATRPRGDPLPARGLALPEAAELQLRGAAAGQGRARADPRPRRAARRGRRRGAGEGPAAEACARGAAGVRRRARRRPQHARRPWPRSTASSAARTPCWPRGR